MYLRRLRLCNLKLINDLTLDFTRDGKPRMFTVFIGENGTCKTSILQAIALAASGRRVADHLGAFVSPSWPHVEREAEDVEVTAEFGFGEIGHEHGREYPGLKPRPRKPPVVSSVLRLPAKEAGFEARSWYGDWLSKPSPTSDEGDPIDLIRRSRVIKPHWFIAGYGVQRRLPSPGAGSDIADPAIERISPIFDRRELTATAFFDAFKRAESTLTEEDGAKAESEDQSMGAERAKRFADVLKKALMTDRGLVPHLNSLSSGGRGSIAPDKLGKAQRASYQAGDKEIRIPAVWLSCGYQSTLAWLSDLIGWILWEAKERVEPQDMEGIVLIDELDLHLHPEWQVGLVKALKHVFPRLQFITTTHSPMLLSGLDDDEIVRLAIKGDQIVEAPTSGTPKMSTGTELLADYFGIDRLIPNPEGEGLWRYAELASNPYRSDDDEEEMRRLLSVLNAAGIDPEMEPEPRVDEG